MMKRGFLFLLLFFFFFLLLLLCASLIGFGLAGWLIEDDHGLLHGFGQLETGTGEHCGKKGLELGVLESRWEAALIVFFFSSARVDLVSAFSLWGVYFCRWRRDGLRQRVWREKGTGACHASRLGVSVGCAL